VLSATKTAVKKADTAIAAGDLEGARQAVRQAISALDRAAKKGVLHPNNVARRKSRLHLKLNAVVAAPPPRVPEPTVREEVAPEKKGTVRRKKAEE